MDGQPDQGAWRSADPEPVCGGEPGGEAWSVRLVNDRLPGRMVTVSYFPVREGGAYRVEHEAEFLICTDPGDPGGTKVWSEYASGTAPGVMTLTSAAETAERKARDLAGGVTTAADLDWNGNPFKRGSDGTIRELGPDDPALGPEAQAWAAAQAATEGGTPMDDQALTGETTTHAAWVQWAAACTDQLDGLCAQMDTMAAQVEADNGDQAQVAAIREWQALVRDVADQGRRMVDEVNVTQLPIGEAVQHAGGPENTPHQEYANEARTGL